MSVWRDGVGGSVPWLVMLSCAALAWPCRRDMLAAVQERYGALQRCADPHGEVAKNFKVCGCGLEGPDYSVMCAS